MILPPFKVKDRVKALRYYTNTPHNQILAGSVYTVEDVVWSERRQWWTITLVGKYDICDPADFEKVEDVK